MSLRKLNQNGGRMNTYSSTNMFLFGKFSKYNAKLNGHFPTHFKIGVP